MKVKFNKIQIIYHGQDERINLPILERKVIDEVVGEVVGNYLGKDVDSLGKLIDSPHFILLLDDGSFTSAPISECKLLNIRR